MTDERRWTIYVCPGCGTVTDYDRSTGCGACEDGPMTVPVVVVPVSSVVPIAALRTLLTRWTTGNAVCAPQLYADGWHEASTAFTHDLAALLDDVECASNPNNEGTT